MVDYKINKYRKLTPKVYKPTYIWVEKVIHWESCKRLKFVRTNKSNEHKVESFQEKEIRKVIAYFEIRIKHSILVF